MEKPLLKSILEAAILSIGTPLPIAAMEKLFEEENPAVTREEILSALETLSEECETRGIELRQLASGYQFRSKQLYANWLRKLWEERPPRYSRALLETLALIAYKQPVTRAEIEDVRGVVVSSQIIKTLLEREWVKVVGHKEVPGRPALYATTKEFLDYFNLKQLSELPTLPDINELFLAEEKLAEQLALEIEGQSELHE